MTIPADAASDIPLADDREKIHRIRDLLAPARNPSQLWVMVLDAQGRQTPLMTQISQRPAFPDPQVVETLVRVLREAIGDVPGGPAQLMFVLERSGPFGTTVDDHCWAATLAGACERFGVAHAGTFLLSRGGVMAVAP